MEGTKFRVYEYRIYTIVRITYIYIYKYRFFSTRFVRFAAVRTKIRPRTERTWNFRRSVVSVFRVFEHFERENDETNHHRYDDGEVGPKVTGISFRSVRVHLESDYLSSVKKQKRNRK